VRWTPATKARRDRRAPPAPSVIVALLALGCRCWLAGDRRQARPTSRRPRLPPA
jgi:hypothetical protein